MLTLNIHTHSHARFIHTRISKLRIVLCQGMGKGGITHKLRSITTYCIYT
ncbi:hypothetical protein E2C01_097827 [Portunus trituberculatus]|uniref:Uncharacterized protein n=1 Tax=Portunus trituberculatus TaxID=210409 RepID=A0A5B7K5V2_PORTR|nr:hypothetical protein [Portunus trituberculatus]